MKQLQLEQLQNVPKLNSSTLHSEFEFVIYDELNNKVVRLSLETLKNFIGELKFESPGTWVDTIQNLRDVPNPAEGNDVGVYNTTGIASQKNLLYQYDESSILDDDGFNIIEPSANDNGGRFVLQAVLAFASLDHKHAKSDITDLIDDLALLQQDLSDAELAINNLVTAVNLRAPLNSPSFTGTPTSPTVSATGTRIINATMLQTFCNNFITVQSLATYLSETNAVVILNASGTLTKIKLAQGQILMADKNTGVLVATTLSEVVSTLFNETDSGIVPAANTRPNGVTPEKCFLSAITTDGVARWINLDPATIARTSAYSDTPEENSSTKIATTKATYVLYESLSSLIESVGDILEIITALGNRNAASGYPGLDALLKFDSSVIAANEPEIDHDKLKNYSVAEHREVNDEVASTITLWSSQKITEQLDLIRLGYAGKESCKVTTKGLGNISLSGLQEIHGYTLLAGNRVCVTAQTNQTENGIYNAAAGAWTRATDFDTNPYGEVTGGSSTYIEDTDNIYKGCRFTVVGNTVKTVGTDPIIWENTNPPQFGTTAGTFTEGNDSRLPTDDEKDALSGTNGTPSNLNKYVTDSDVRLHTHDNKSVLDATEESYTTAKDTKLTNIETGAQVNVKPDWDATPGAANEILNLPTTFPSSSHTHESAQINDLGTVLEGYVTSSTLDGVTGVDWDGTTLKQVVDTLYTVTQDYVTSSLLATALEDYADTEHNHDASNINALTGYVIADAFTALAPSDTLNQALGKLEKGVIAASTNYWIYDNTYLNLSTKHPVSIQVPTTDTKAVATRTLNNADRVIQQLLDTGKLSLELGKNIDTPDNIIVALTKLFSSGSGTFKIAFPTGDTPTSPEVELDATGFALALAADKIIKRNRLSNNTSQVNYQWVTEELTVALGATSQVSTTILPAEALIEAMWLKVTQDDSNAIATTFKVKLTSYASPIGDLIDFKSCIVSNSFTQHLLTTLDVQDTFTLVTDAAPTGSTVKVEITMLYKTLSQ